MIDTSRFCVLAKEMFGLSVSPSQAELLDKFAEEVVETNKKFNLTSITDSDAFLEKHLLDSVAAAPLIPEGAKCCDVGAGAGFPSVPLAVVREDISVTALDSTLKKTAFVAGVAKKLGIENLFTLTKRAEECVHERESFDVVFARAVAPLPVLLELSLHLVKKGGVFVAYKTDDSELSSSLRAAGKNGGKFREKHGFSLPDDSRRCLLVFDKVSPCPADYPRKYSLIKSSPL